MEEEVGGKEQEEDKTGQATADGWMYRKTVGLLNDEVFPPTNPLRRHVSLHVYIRTMLAAL